MNFTKFLFLFLVFCGLSAFSSDYTNFCYGDVIDKITGAVASKLKKEKRLFCVGSGGRMMYLVDSVSVSLDYFKHISRENGRKMIVSVVQEYLKAINENKEIRMYLKRYPFQVEDMDVMIFFRTPDGGTIPMNEISCITQCDGVVSYNLNRIVNGKEKYLTDYEESYEEALEILTKNR